MEPLHTLAASDAVRLIRSGEMSSLEYADALLARCRSFSRLGAFIDLDGASVRAQARAADRARAVGRWLGPLHGIPVAVKDNIDVAGAVTTAGTPGLLRNLASRDAEVVVALRRAGAIPFGKTNMHELAYGLTSDNAHFGCVRNPWRPERIAGGSSGGNAAALAAGLVPLALGTDTGGSVRQPASLCGIAGLRPSLGRYPRGGVVTISRTRDTVGPMGRTVADLALLDGAVTGCDGAPHPAALERLRLGIPRAYFWDSLDPDVREVLEAELDRLAGLGVEFVDADLPGIEGCNARIGRPIFMAEALEGIAAYLAGRPVPVAPEGVLNQVASADVRALVQEQRYPADKAALDAAYRMAVDCERPALINAYREYFARHRVAALVLPTCRLTASLVGENSLVSVCGNDEPVTAAYVHNTGPASLVGIPGLSLPAGLTKQGLPVGMELDGPSGTDRSLLAIGLAIESSRSRRRRKGIGGALSARE